MTESENIDPRDQWFALADEEAEALGIGRRKVREAVEAELIDRAAKKIADKLTKRSASFSRDRHQEPAEFLERLYVIAASEADDLIDLGEDEETVRKLIRRRGLRLVPNESSEDPDEEKGASKVCGIPCQLDGESRDVVLGVLTQIEFETTRTALLNTVESQLSWRESKVAEYPEDERNRISVKSLSLLSRFVRTLKPTDARLGQWEHLRIDDVIYLGEDASKELSRYGGAASVAFFQPMDPTPRYSILPHAS